MEENVLAFMVISFFLYFAFELEFLTGTNNIIIKLCKKFQVFFFKKQTQNKFSKPRQKLYKSRQKGKQGRQMK